jgi:hypothetical protein
LAESRFLELDASMTAWAALVAVLGVPVQLEKEHVLLGHRLVPAATMSEETCRLGR